VPQSAQNLARGSVSAPHCGQRGCRGSRTRCRTWRRLDCQTRNAGSAWGSPQARRCKRPGYGWAGVPTHTPDRPVMDGVSVLHTRTCVKGKAQQGSRPWSGGGRRLRLGHRHRHRHGGPFRAPSESLVAITRGAHVTHVWRSRSSGRWSVAAMRLHHLTSDRHKVTRACIPPSRCASICKKCPLHDDALARDSKACSHTIHVALFTRHPSIKPHIRNHLVQCPAWMRGGACGNGVSCLYQRIPPQLCAFLLPDKYDRYGHS
jgi:hypothetical protein